jgi:Flp pilus assembly pilin Flp
LNDQTGGEVIEYVLIAALISVAAITLIAWVGTKVAAKWTSVKSSL